MAPRTSCLALPCRTGAPPARPRVRPEPRELLRWRERETQWRSQQHSKTSPRPLADEPGPPGLLLRSECPVRAEMPAPPGHLAPAEPCARVGVRSFVPAGVLARPSTPVRLPWPD